MCILFSIITNMLLTVQAMEKLHQLDVFGSRLVVEYAKASYASVVHEAKLDKYVSQTLLCLSQGYIVHQE